ncbi:MAG: hypothetical protein Ta2B_03860 [Termitinemataceae bacterium]|nr:MAG: hypothetical protein Ta2B_03860 [Termitinemataceae bacterium]
MILDDIVTQRIVDIEKKKAAYPLNDMRCDAEAIAKNDALVIKISAAEQHTQNKAHAEGAFVLPESCTPGLIPPVTPQRGGVLNPTARINGLPFEVALKSKRSSGAQKSTLQEQTPLSYELSFICEVKKASPSKGIIAADFPYLQIAKDYQNAGAKAISVLTEPHFFMGSSEYLKEIACNVALPALCKDFIIDPYQIYEAKVLGASAVLLICALLDDARLKDFLSITKELKLSALVETHNEEEVQRALNADADIIGVNNRDLKTFKVDLGVCARLRALVPSSKIFVAESGINSAADVQMLRSIGADAALIGEAMMRAQDKTEYLNSINGIGEENKNPRRRAAGYFCSPEGSNKK